TLEWPVTGPDLALGWNACRNRGTLFGKGVQENRCRNVGGLVVDPVLALGLEFTFDDVAFIRIRASNPLIQSIADLGLQDEETTVVIFPDYDPLAGMRYAADCREQQQKQDGKAPLNSGSHPAIASKSFLRLHWRGIFLSINAFGRSNVSEYTMVGLPSVLFSILRVPKADSLPSNTLPTIGLGPPRNSNSE